jgi:hypothetical protein
MHMGPELIACDVARRPCHRTERAAWIRAVLARTLSLSEALAQASPSSLAISVTGALGLSAFTLERMSCCCGGVAEAQEGQTRHAARGQQRTECKGCCWLAGHDWRRAITTHPAIPPRRCDFKPARTAVKQK